MSPMPAMLPSGRRAVMPDTNTKRPVASIAVACEKTPVGWRSFGDMICVLAMVFLLLRFVKWRCHDAELAGKARQHGDDRGLESDGAAGALTPAPFWFARREQLLDASCAATGANMFGGGGGVLAEPIDVAEMRDIDCDEEMRAVIRHAEVAIERPHLRAGRALRQQPAHQIDHEGKAKALGAAGRQQHAGDRFGSVGR